MPREVLDIEACYFVFEAVAGNMYCVSLPTVDVQVQKGFETNTQSLQGTHHVTFAVSRVRLLNLLPTLLKFLIAHHWSQMKWAIHSQHLKETLKETMRYGLDRLQQR